MPIAGEEGYEELVICPYDRSHEIRRGRMQFHLNKCRKNHPTDEMVQCAFNSVHIVPKMEEQFHTEEECGSRVTWDMHNYEVGDNTCPVKDLVDVNAATVPYGSENWDDFEAPGSVIETIKQAAAEKKIFRYLQCESKAKRRMFREEERLRHSELEAGGINTFQESPSTRPILGLHPLERSNTTPLFRQDHTEAVASVTKQFQNLSKPSTSESETSSACNKPPFALASAAPSTSFFPDPTSRPSSSMSSALSTSSRSSAKTPTPEDMFCQVPIPGLGRGRRRKLQQSSIN